ncbi:hypothetical protein [Kutzneria buriramensis]|nr:hypothetical protein [Kutzneria buriramensis]
MTTSVITANTAASATRTGSSRRRYPHQAAKILAAAAAEMEVRVE